MARPLPTVKGEIETEIPHGAKLLLAVSGGLDSMCLLHACLQQQEKKKLNIHVAHVNHNLRAESAADAEFVRAFTARHNVPLHLHTLSAPAAGENTELWGRKERYAFFTSILKVQGLDFMLTAHHANDLAETLLMRLVSNKDLRSIERFDPRRRCLRPLLSVSREQIADYAREHNLSWVEDKSNQNTRFLRNRVRHVLLPLLHREFEPNIVRILAEQAQGIADDISALESMLEQPLQRTRSYDFGCREWLRCVQTELAALPPTLCWRFTEKLFHEKLSYNLGRLHSSLTAAFLSGTDLQIQLPGGIVLRRQDGGISGI